MRLLIPVLAAGLVCAMPMGVRAQEPAAKIGAAQGTEAGRPAAAHDMGAEHDVNTESLFGFSSGSDMDQAGTLAGGLELNGDFARRAGRYTALGAKLGLTYAVTDDFATSFNLFGGYRNIHGDPELGNTSSLRFDGVGAEFRWRLLRRGPSPVGVTLQIEPSLRTASGETVKRGLGGGVENKLIIDTALVPDKVFAAVNLIYEFDSFKLDHEVESDRASGFGVSGAVAMRVAPEFFIGGEMRYMRAYEGLGLNRYQGDALFVGPTLFWQVSPDISVAAAFSAQVAGSVLDSNQTLDLLHFTRYQAKLKIGVEF